MPVASPSPRQIQAAAILLALSTLVLGAAECVQGTLVTRRTLFGYEVRGQLLDAHEAAETIASFRARARAAFASAAAHLAKRGYHGALKRGRIEVIKQRACYVVDITPDVDSPHEPRHFWKAYRDALICEGEWVVGGGSDATLIWLVGPPIDAPEGCVLRDVEARS